MLQTVMITILIAVIIAMLPGWPYNRHLNWGYWPSGMVGVILLLLIIVILLEGM